MPSPHQEPAAGDTDLVQTMAAVHQRNLASLQQTLSLLGDEAPLSILNEIKHQKRQLAILQALSDKQPGVSKVFVLPRRKSPFVGRDQEKSMILEALNERQVTLIYGPAGAGKSTLANRVAWDAADLFPDGAAWYAARGEKPLSLLRKIIDDFDQEHSGLGGHYSVNMPGAAAEVDEDPAHKRHLVLISQSVASLFNKEELDELCYLLGVDYEDLPAHGKSGKVRELVKYLDRRRKISALFEAVDELRPDLDWKESLALAEDTSEPESDGDWAEVAAYAEVLNHYKQVMSRKRALICFDHVETAEQIQDAVTWAPQCGFLLTSRSFIDISANATLNLSELDEGAAANLLSRIVGAAAVEPEQVQAIYARLGGLPLALELAGKLVQTRRVSGLADLVGILYSDKALNLLGTGEGSLRFSLELAYAELSVEQQAVFASLALLCAEGFSEAAVQAMWRRDVSEAIEELTSVALLDRHRGKLALNPLIHDFALDKLATLENVDALTEALTEYYLAFCIDHETDFAQLAGEDGNIAIAIDRALAQESYNARASQALNSTYFYLDAKGRWEAIEEWFPQAVEKAHDAGDTGNELRLRRRLVASLIRKGGWDEAEALIRINLAIDEHGDEEASPEQLWGRQEDLFELAKIKFAHGDFSQAIRLFTRCYEASVKVDSKRGIADALRYIAAVVMHEGRYNECEALLRKCQPIYEELGDVYNVADVAKIRGFAAHELRQLEQAYNFLQQYRETMIQLGDTWGQHSGSHELGRVALAMGRYDEAEELLDDALKRVDELGDYRGRSATLHEKARLLFARGDLSEARALLAESTAIRKRIEDSRGLGDNYYQDGRIALAQGRVDEAESLFVKSYKIRRTINDKRGLAAVLYWLARTKTRKSLLQEAWTMHTTGLKIAQSISHQFWIGKHLAGLGMVADRLGRQAESVNYLDRSRELLKPHKIAPEDDDLLVPDI